jgi:GR25 family glycosyltransferase involved in LPS biosynthesis
MKVTEFPLYYISFKRSSEIENHYQLHGFKNVNHFPAVNGKKMHLRRLLDDKIISIQAYEDIIYGRETKKGMPGKGAIGCTLSHYELWKLCVKKGYPFIIIAEEDNRITKKLDNKDLNSIKNTLAKENGVFMSNVKRKKKGRVHFFGTHFYIASLAACKKLIENAFPIDVQTDWYMGHMSRVKYITIEGYPVSDAVAAPFTSSIQDFCMKCILPNSTYFYVGVILAFVVLLVLVIVFAVKYKICRNSP